MNRDNFEKNSYAAEVTEQVREAYKIDRSGEAGQGVKYGLRNEDGTGVLAGVTRIGSVRGYYIEDGARMPMEGQLFFRGIDVADIVKANREADRFGYEEVCYLLLMGSLPNKQQLNDFCGALAKARELPENFTEDVLMRAPSRDIMNKLASSILSLYAYDPMADDNSLENMLRISIELIGRFPIIVANSYAIKRHYFDGKSLHIHRSKENLSLSENFLRVVRSNKQYTDDEAKLLDTMLVIHAEHGGGNNSAFVCRAMSSTGTDTYSAIAGAVGSLKGPLHGGANAKVMEMYEYIKANVSDPNDDGQLKDYLSRLIDGTAGDGSGKIYGLGHAVYTLSDPRTTLLKQCAREVAEQKGALAELELMERVETIGIPLLMEKTHQSTPMCANVDMYSGLIYRMLGIPQEMYTPLFATARIAGWCAHRIEEVMTGGKIMRPAYRAAVRSVPYIPMDER